MVDALGPNIILVQTDALRATALGLYGNQDVRTPHLERMADEGVLFERAFCASPSCVPSRSALLTGRYPHTNRSRVNSVLLHHEERTFPQELRAAGYRTALAGKNHAYPQRGSNSVQEVFDLLYEVGHDGPVEPTPNPQINKYKEFLRGLFLNDVKHLGEPWYPATTPFPVEVCSTRLTMDAALSFIRQCQSPFMLWCSIAEPHTPYTAPEPYASMYEPEAIQMPESYRDDLSTKPSNQALTQIVQRMDTEPESHVREGLAMYYGMIRFIDDEVGRLFEELKILGIDENTIVVFTSDHGEYVGAHGMISKANQMYDALMQVPLIIRWPGSIEGGRRIEHLTEQIDIAPTLLELCSVPRPPGMQARSMVGLLMGDEDYQSRSMVFGESGLEGESTSLADAKQMMADERAYHWGARPEAWRGRVKMLRTDRWKFCYYLDGQSELYDLWADPHEMHNLAALPEHVSLINGFVRDLLNWCIETEDTLPVWPAQ